MGKQRLRNNSYSGTYSELDISISSYLKQLLYCIPKDQGGAEQRILLQAAYQPTHPVGSYCKQGGRDVEAAAHPSLMPLVTTPGVKDTGYQPKTDSVSMFFLVSHL